MKSVSKLELPIAIGAAAFLVAVSLLAIAATRRTPTVEIIESPSPSVSKPLPAGETPVSR
ncbi:hypothetical protein A2856_03275 [Candidatus Uhrbacteria bacterium RIFCSPHIGHO2_01_FULL_63_20]|uniref:Uncharacterized protein n=1 Tax=Candidatus Uhrbacteria bacterium RIFCSPHIGHO2_01_FULL_63_20 TaxID=1802385 RepID=A0A1F7TLA1_9BACT|nr:MAG: hypothetical protein A2856_03275 [Candidatus Uhrbacteria bacterium RIFCSPHIGHO2_01_FULL_63_20]